MIDFIYKLYGYDNFTLYLTIAIVVLIILFVLVLIFGKKDQKLEETKRLQKIELEQALKKENEQPVKLETIENEIKEETKEVLPVVEESVMPDVTEPAIEEEPISVKEAEVIVFEPMEIEEEENLPELNFERPVRNNSNKDTDEENAPIKVDELPEFSFDDINDSLEKNLNELENIKQEFNSIEIPNVKENVKEEPKVAFQPSQVFSSVFVTKDEEMAKEKTIDLTQKNKIEPTITVLEEDDDFDLPTLKIMDEPKKEETEVKIDLNIDSPVKDVKEENVDTFSFDDLVGETYNIK